ncbi:hypothetical protein BO71DRAFT_488619 [Aspergillus ellipticus CBS 707.79]|uniref:YjgF-like protein n=1 Tax=Aspergillus ellipticus CBS 707.79 TaxID=1448320 RepID=A0A319CTN7_9EURO|nr:hypothetical protein BO71DRAFT_488619 [Aspergillus ellipticus CBS 707.79]
MLPLPATATRAKNTVTNIAMHSQAIRAGDHVWLSGQIPADAQGNLIRGSIADQTQAIIRNTDAILQEAGSGLDRVVKRANLGLCDRFGHYARVRGGV